MALMFSRGDKLENGHYTIIKEIGVGGMGVVFHCRDEQLLRDVAIKMLLPELLADKQNVEVFRQEARLAAQLEHPNIVTIYDVGMEERQRKSHHYVSMEYLPGGNLANRVISGPLAVEHCLNWMKQLASGLNFAHKKGVIHQDIKADNIFITNEGDLKIGDFGLARLLVGRVHCNTATKGMGTPAYMSPELCRGEPQDHRSDIYSLGVLFFEMATGQLPFRARGMIEMATKHSSAPIPSAKRINPLIPEILDKVIRRMMAKTPEERYPSMSEVLTILDDLIFELRVARLGLGNRPLLRSGPVGTEMGLPLLPSNKPEVQAPPPVLPAAQEPSLPGAWTRTDHAKRSKPDTEPHTTSLPPVDREQVSTLEAKRRRQPLSPSEQLIHQLEQAAPESHHTPNQNNSPTRTAGHFVTTQQVHPLITPMKKTPTPEEAADQSPSPRTSFDQGNITRRLSGPDPETESPEPVPAPAAATTSSAPLASASSAAVAAPPVVPTASPEEAAMTTSPHPGSSSYITPSIAVPPRVVQQYAREVTSQSTGAGSRPSPTAGQHSTPQARNTPIPSAPPARESAGSSKESHRKQLSLPKLRQGPLLRNLKPGLDLQWSFKANGPIGWSSAPVMDKEEQVVYVGSADGCIYALDAQSGAQRWSARIGSPIVASPTVAGDKIIAVGSSGLIVAVSARDGKTLWRFNAGETLVSTPCQLKDMLIVPGAKGMLFAIETHGGVLRWQYKAEGAIVSTPQRHADLVLFGTRSGDFHALSVDSGRGVWRFSAGSPIVASPAASVDSVYFGTLSGAFCALEAERGGLIWEYPCDTPIISRAAISFTSVMFCSNDKWLYCCERYDGTLKWKGSLRGTVVANLVSTRDTMITVTREGWIQAFSTSNGELKWQRDIGRCLESAPLITADKFLLCTVEGEVLAYTFSNASALSEKSA